MKKISFLLISFLIFGCKSEPNKDEAAESTEGNTIPVDYAKGFTLTDFGNYKILTVENPWPEADVSYRYLLAEKDAEIPKNIKYDQKITVPVEKVVVTSTTHIPSLEVLEEEQTLVGFPGLDYISSEETRKLINNGSVTELGKNEAINTEILLDLQPDVVIGFSLDGSNKTFNTIQKSGIPVVFNGDWTESSPLGKAEWIKFFGAFYNKSEEAAEFFKEVSAAYEDAKKLAENSSSQPTVISGAMYQDQWYLPAGDSWQAQFMEDANANYLYSDSRGSGSISLSFENVLEKAKDADFWAGPAQFLTYEEMENTSQHYREFDAFQKKNIYTFASATGTTGGVIFYELAPIRPDLVLKDLISIFHPELLPNYETTFYKPLQ
ncbi:ABC transporter substrate-binding protein [Salinimicrobium marinum]|uniref:ABC transporter substrate-binding protein n=1 Tax=Salinimicrobium marinum TaxID=680283 RepID=UPI0016770A28|nr:ABC transporter substrate-binding protein [Salinimicrobium marinum]